MQLVISDAHQGLKGAIAAVLQGAAWQRCRVHFVRNALALVPKSAAQMVAASIRISFSQPDAASTREHWRRVADGFRDRFPRLADLLDEVEEDVLSLRLRRGLLQPAETPQALGYLSPVEFERRYGQALSANSDRSTKTG